MEDNEFDHLIGKIYMSLGMRMMLMNFAVTFTYILSYHTYDTRTN